jgi:hypothetical protein
MLEDGCLLVTTHSCGWFFPKLNGSRDKCPERKNCVYGKGCTNCRQGSTNRIMKWLAKWGMSRLLWLFTRFFHTREIWKPHLLPRNYFARIIKVIKTLDRVIWLFEHVISVAWWVIASISKEGRRIESRTTVVTLEAHWSGSKVNDRSRDTSGKYCCTSPHFWSLLSCDARGVTL